MNFKNKLNAFMRGRYGPDELYNFLFIIYIIVFIIDLFTKSLLFNYFEIVIIFTIFYRFFSKNIYRRKKENQKFINIKNKVLKPFKNIKRNIKDKEHVYKKCPKCKTVLKLPLPSKKGFKSALCPHCKNRVKLFTLKKERIEIITKK